jgi:glycogen debranching enzyme
MIDEGAGRAPVAESEVPAASPAVEDPFYIVASSPHADEQARVLKQGETFAVFDHYGDIKKGGLGDEGLYHEGTRHLSSHVLRLNADRPLMLSSTVKEDNALLAVDLTNPDVYAGGQVVVPRGTLHLFRTKVLWEAACHERIEIHNYGLHPVEASITFYFEADFADIFEVRGTRRARRGRLLAPAVTEDSVRMSYEGLDGIVRHTRVQFRPRPVLISGLSVRFDLALAPHAETTLYLTTSCASGEPPGDAPPYDEAVRRSERRLQRRHARRCEIESPNERFGDWLRRSSADLDMMVTDKAEGPYPYAGVPWFSTPFGRDGIITALECLWHEPDLARGVLAYLAATQATEEIPAQDAEPGKILHETRCGEMANLGEIPFGRYYGSVDATPLFVMLAGAYWQRTGDIEFTRGLWPHVELALDWMDTYGDADEDGFVEYRRMTPRGLVQQGWKDSEDSVFHADGTLAAPPIALCEVQGYAYAARVAAAEMSTALGQLERAMHLSHQAWALRERFEHAFWVEALGSYALALDGDKRPCAVRTSNAGHCLFAGIAAEERAPRVAEALLERGGCSGWGVRTVAAGQARYNPMSYHNGSVWPHDNAIIAAGFARYRLKAQAARVMEGMFHASQFFDLHRMPELFCGFDHRGGEGPTLYPVACAPQSWAAAAVYLMLQACLGLEVRGDPRQVTLRHPMLPPFLSEVTIRSLDVGGSHVDLLIRRHGEDVGVNVLRREGDVEIVSIK